MIYFFIGITIWIGTLIAFLLGYHLGNKSLPDISEKIRSLKESITPIQVGAINTLTAEQEEEEKNPKRKEGLEAMRETLQKVFSVKK